MWGRPVPLSAARALADTHGLALVEDCSHAHGARCDSSQVGTTGDAAVFSLGTTKLVSGGLAGALVTRDNVLYERAVTFGQPKHRVLARVSDAALRDLALTGAGHNLRCSPVAAILAADHLERLPETVRIKNGNLARLRAAMQALLPSLVPLPASDQPSAGTLYKFHARWRGPDVTAQETRDLLATAGTRARRPAAALHTLPLFTDPDVLAALYPQAPNPARTHAGDYPRTDDFLADLIEFDTRDLYHESPVIAHHYERALDLAASKLRGGGC
jgi:dTDP-4-amino-4,6-dideoxygalactose transaminase